MIVPMPLVSQIQSFGTSMPSRASRLYWPEMQAKRIDGQ